MSTKEKTQPIPVAAIPNLPIFTPSLAAFIIPVAFLISAALTARPAAPVTPINDESKIKFTCNSNSK